MNNRSGLKLKPRLFLKMRHFIEKKVFTHWHWNFNKKKEKKPWKRQNCLCICLCSCSPLCCSCIASGATSLSMTKQIVWLLWPCPAWWNTPCSRCCLLATTGTYTHPPTAKPTSSRTTAWTGAWWGLSTWERDVASSTGNCRNGGIWILLMRFGSVQKT